MGKNRTYDVIIIGAGATGAGTARDCALRGLRTLLLEQADFAHGATGRNHGLLHSGARYACSDPVGAAECAEENRILRQIARHCVEATGGWFVALPGDDLDYGTQLIEACRATGVDAVDVDPREALRLEPALNPDLTRAISVPDASIDPFALTLSNILDAQRHGATLLTRHRVDRFVVSGGRMEGVEGTDHTGRRFSFRAPVVIIAAGIWTSPLLRLVDIEMKMLPAKGTMLIFDHRLCRRVVNRCRQPGDGDIIVPDGGVSIVGTTSKSVDYSQIDDPVAGDDEAERLLAESKLMVPGVNQDCVLRAYAGVRPLVADVDDPTGRAASRGITLIDHASAHGVEGLITITGGKLITYRLMAERATDLACRRLGIDAACKTATQPLPGSETPSIIPPKPHTPLWRHGTLARAIDMTHDGDRTIVCECEGVTVGEIRYAINHLGARTLDDIRRRTRLGMGQCQGRKCACRAAEVMAYLLDHELHPEKNMTDFLLERWKGIRATGGQHAMREAQQFLSLYQQLGGIGLDGAVPVGNGKEKP